MLAYSVCIIIVGMSLAQSVLIADFNAETDELSLVPGENNARIFGGEDNTIFSLYYTYMSTAYYLLISWFLTTINVCLIFFLQAESLQMENLSNVSMHFPCHWQSPTTSLLDLGSSSL